MYVKSRRDSESQGVKKIQWQSGGRPWKAHENPQDPKIEEVQGFCPGLKLSSENETFNRECDLQASHTGSTLWGILEVEIELFKRE